MPVYQMERVDKDVGSLEESDPEESFSEGDEESDGGENDSCFDNMRPLLLNYTEDIDKSISEASQTDGPVEALPESPIVQVKLSV